LKESNFLLKAKTEKGCTALSLFDNEKNAYSEDVIFCSEILHQKIELAV
jgi:hypothetical protein